MAASPEYKYDVFISYRHLDRDWVENELLPPLEAVGLKVCIDFRDFEIGAPSVKNMERAVETSLRTIIVLTPEWIQSEWTEFESLLLSGKDPAGRQRRLIPVLLKPCICPPRIAMLTYADFTQVSRRKNEMKRLIKMLLEQQTLDPLPSSGAPTPPQSALEPSLPIPPDLSLAEGDDALFDEGALADLLVRSGRADYPERRALCLELRLDPDELNFLSLTTTRDFALQLVHDLIRTGNDPALRRLCDVLRRRVKGQYLLKLEQLMTQLPKGD